MENLNCSPSYLTDNGPQKDRYDSFHSQVNEITDFMFNREKTMIIGCGIDLVSIDRIKKIINRWESHFLRKVYTEQEIMYCEMKNTNRYQSYAGMFAAKEAYVKALGTGFRQISWKEIEVDRDDQNKPIIRLSERLSRVNNHRNIDSVYVSISHTKKYAVAQVIIEG